MFGKFFAQTFTGSMFGKGPVIFSVWSYIIANKDENGILELNPSLLAAIIGECTEEDIEAAIEFLAAPDPRSRSKKLDGRRIVQEGELQWQVVNNEEYREIARREQLRESNRERKRQQRERDRHATVTPSHAESRNGHASSLSLPSISGSDSDKEDKIEALRLLWNTYAEPTKMAVCLPFGTSANARKRIGSIWARLKEHPSLKEWTVVVSRIAGRPYCRGINDEGWAASIDYLTRVSTFDDHFTGKFARAPELVLDSEVESSEKESISEGLSELVLELQECANGIEDENTRALVLIAAEGVNALKGLDYNQVVGGGMKLEDELMESLAKVWPGAKEIEDSCKATENETGIKWKALRDRRIRAALNLPRLDF